MKALFIIILTALLCSCGARPTFKAIVEAEDTVYTYEAANNGAGPMWSFGNTSIVRYGDHVFTAGLETLKDVKPLHNTRWMLFGRNGSGWEMLHKDEKGRTREPSPLCVFDDGRLFLSVNPTLTPPGAYDGPAQPRVLQFSALDSTAPLKTLLPVWNGEPKFTEHSYRSFVADGDAHEMILFQNIGYTHSEWSFYDRDGNWSAQGRLDWPWGAGYEEPEPIRVCYPAVQLVNRAVYFLGVSDIIEPNKEWRAFKFKLTDRKWDYDFRRLFYTWSRDITTGKFEDWVEVASREKTGGRITPCDLWVAPDGLVHILWTEQALDERLREKYFPNEKQSWALNYGIIKNGALILRKPIMISDEGAKLLPGRGRFQITPDNRLFVLYYVHGKKVKENRLVEILADHSISTPVAVALQRPLGSFYTATIRGGCKPSYIIDVFGQDDPLKMRYARIRIVANEL